MKSKIDEKNVKAQSALERECRFANEDMTIL